MKLKSLIILLFSFFILVAQASAEKIQNSYHIVVTVSKETLQLFKNDELVKTYKIGTAKNGTGQFMGSEQTPLGEFTIDKKIGEGAAPNTVFDSRKPTGEIFSSTLDAEFPGRPWVLTRIMWLQGMEWGYNRGGAVDTKSRYIYIHGVPDRVTLGKPTSDGCVNMTNEDVIDLYNRVPEGTRVTIVA